MRETGKEMILIYGKAGGEALEVVLQGNGFEVLQVEEREEVCRLFEQDADMVLLALGQENKAEGLAQISALRQISGKPILVMPEANDEILRIMALNAGADDCVGGDCSVLESVARIQAQLRCYKRLVRESGRQSKIIRMDGIEVDDTAKLVKVGGNRVDLTPTEYKILHLLMEKPGRVLSNRQIYEEIWHMEPVGVDNTVAVHIRHIREKIEENPQNPRFLRVVWGQGYKVG